MDKAHASMNRKDHPLENLPGYMLRRAANNAMGELAGRLAEIDLRIAETTVMMLVDRAGQMTAAQVGRLLDIKRANMVPLLNRLEEAELIWRRPMDGRSQAIALTDQGQARAAQAVAIVEAFETELLTQVPAEHREHLLPALKALAEF